MSNSIKWTKEHLFQHLQFAFDLEFWTIPYYMTAMYSLKNPGSEAYKLIQSVCFQEMLHVQLIANIANAFGLSPTVNFPVYKGTNIPHLNFALDADNPLQMYPDFSAELGPLDEVRIQTMCLIEYPEWSALSASELKQTVTDYSSIGHFYQALSYGAQQHVDDIKAGRNQVDWFLPFYVNPDGPASFVISAEGEQGLQQILNLIETITEQGEGLSKGKGIPENFQNRIDDPKAASDHYQKFSSLLAMDAVHRECYEGQTSPPPGSAGRKAQKIYNEHFKEFCEILTTVFSGGAKDSFSSGMSKTGAAMANCWKNGAIPLLEKSGVKS